MSAIIEDSTLLDNAQLNARKTSLALGSIEVYSGTPVAVNTADPGVSPCLIFDDVSLGTASAGAISSDGGTYETVGLSVATATWWRYYNSTKTMWTQGTAAISGGSMNLSTTAITVDGPVAITSINFHY